jgi:hypothetical protein
MDTVFGDKTKEYGYNNTQQQVRGPQYIDQNLYQAAGNAAGQFFGDAPESYVTRQGRDLIGQTLRGDFLSTENPYLGQLSQNIGDNVFNQTSQRFAGAGRNVGGADAQGVFRDDLTNQLAPIFHQDYSNERMWQNNALGMSSQFDPLNQFIQRMSPLSNMAGRDVTTENQYSGTNRSRGSAADIITGLITAG